MDLDRLTSHINQPLQRRKLQREQKASLGSVGGDSDQVMSMLIMCGLGPFGRGGGMDRREARNERSCIFVNSR
ncbi:hypothetical protein HI914_06685 [Erysiphe necator]|nr:hypothetical protein HI914_06685 [Erysiphe necator]